MVVVNTPSSYALPFLSPLAAGLKEVEVTTYIHRRHSRKNPSLKHSKSAGELMVGITFSAEHAESLGLSTKGKLPKKDLIIGKAILVQPSTMSFLMLKAVRLIVFPKTSSKISQLYRGSSKIDVILHGNRIRLYLPNPTKTCEPVEVEQPEIDRVITIYDDSLPGVGLVKAMVVPFGYWYDYGVGGEARTWKK